jgi:DNA repair exonuclease SbcCD ATPase subunit
MVIELEIDLSELNDWYSKRLNEIYMKDKKMLFRFVEMIKKEVSSINYSLDGWLSPSRKPNPEAEPLDSKSKKVLERFIQKLKEYLSEIKFPAEDIKYSEAEDLINSIKKLFANYNDLGKKSVGFFMKQYSLEMKELQMFLGNIEKNFVQLDKYLRKKCKKLGEAEQITKNIPRLQTEIERLAQIKESLHSLEEKLNQKKMELEGYEKNYESLLDQKEILELENLRNQIRKYKAELDGKVKLGKVFKKLRKVLEENRSGLLRQFKVEDVKALSKDTVEFLMADGVKMPRFKEVLIAIRLLIENIETEGDVLQLSGDSREKALENIEQLLNQPIIPNMLEELYKYEAQREALEKIIKEKGYMEKITELKEKISVNSADLEHMTADYNRRKNEYSELIQKVKQLREKLQQDIKKEIKEDVKIKIQIAY